MVFVLYEVSVARQAPFSIRLLQIQAELNRVHTQYDWSTMIACGPLHKVCPKGKY